MSSSIDSGAGIESPIWFVLALALDSENNFIIVELVFAVELLCTDKSYIVKQLNYVWLTAEITVKKLQLRMSCTLIASMARVSITWCW